MRALCAPNLPACSLPLLQRRLILGAVAAVGLGAFALVPTGKLQLSKPNKPLFFYLVPLMRCGRMRRWQAEGVRRGNTTFAGHWPAGGKPAKACCASLVPSKQIPT